MNTHTKRHKRKKKREEEKGRERKGMEGKFTKGWKENSEREDGILWESITHGSHLEPFVLVWLLMIVVAVVVV